MTGAGATTEERAAESVSRLRNRLDAAVADIQRLLDDIEATAIRIAAKGGGRTP